MLFLALAILLCGFVPGRVDAASLVKDATLTVKQTVTGTSNGTSEKFEYELNAGCTYAGRKQWGQLPVYIKWKRK